MRYLLAVLIILAGLFPACVQADPTAGLSSGICGAYSGTAGNISITGSTTAYTPQCGWYQITRGVASTSLNGVVGISGSTILITGTTGSGPTVTVSICGHPVLYTYVAGDTTTTLAANHIAAAIAADGADSQLVTATNSTNNVLLPGTQTNVSCPLVVTPTGGAVATIIGTGMGPGEPAGEWVGMADPNLTHNACVAFSQATPNTGAGGGDFVLAWALSLWNLQTNVLSTPQVVAMGGFDPSSGQVHDNAYCIPLGFGSYMFAYGSHTTSIGLGGSGTNASRSDLLISTTVNPGTAYPITLTINTNTGTGLRIGELMYADPTAGTFCTGTCEPMVVSSCNNAPTCAGTATSVTVIGWNGQKFANQTHTANWHLVSVSNFTTLGPWNCTNAAAALTLGNGQTCNAFKIVGASDTANDVAASKEFYVGGGLAQWQAARNGNQTIIVGNVINPFWAKCCGVGINVYQATGAKTGYFLAGCPTGDEATCQANGVAPGGVCMNDDLCYDPINDVPAKANSKFTPELTLINLPPHDNEYGEMDHAGTTLNGSNTDTVKVNNAAANCTVTWTEASAHAFNAVSQALWIAAFNGAAGCTGATGGPYIAIPIAGSTTAVAIEANGTTDIATGMTNNFAIGVCQAAGAACTPTSSRTSGSHNRQLAGTLAKLRNGFYYFIDMPDVLTGASTTIAVQSSNFGYYLLCYRTTGVISVSGGQPTMTFTDCNGGHSFTRGPVPGTILFSNATYNIFGSSSSEPTAQSDYPFCTTVACAQGMTPYAVPNPPGMLAAGIQPMTFISNQESDAYSNDNGIGGAGFVNSTGAASCTGGATCGPGVVQITANQTNSIAYAGQILAFDCKTVTTSPCEQAMITDTSGNFHGALGTPGTFKVTLANSHTTASMTITGNKIPLASANSEQIEQLNSTTLEIVCEGIVPTSTGTLGTKVLYAFQFHPATGLSDNLVVLKTATGAVSGAQTQAMQFNPATGVTSFEAVVGKASEWGGTTNGPGIMQFTTRDGVSFTGPTSLSDGSWSSTANGTPTGQCIDSFDLLTFLCVVQSNSGAFNTNWTTWLPYQSNAP